MDAKTETQANNLEPMWAGSDWITALFLFLSTAAVVVWQNSRVGVLWDLSCVLNHAYRISLGDLPYRDFPIPFAPLTFVIQAALIKLTGRVFFHHVLYCATVGGLATVLTWRILLNLLHETVAFARTIALLLSVPLIVFGVYCIYPHPFYDPDCTLFILLGLLLLQQAERRGFPSIRAFLTGTVLVIPLFVKQSTGLAFLICACLALLLLIGLEAWRHRPVAGLVWTLTGAMVGIGLALCILHVTVGLINYERWTIQYAATRRLPAVAAMVDMYSGRTLIFWLASFAIGTVVARLSRQGTWVLAAVSGFFISLPFTCVVAYLFINKDPSARVGVLVSVWPFMLIVSTVLGLLQVRRRTGMNLVMPFILVGTVNGALLSQQLRGSTYGIWPLLIILLAGVITTYVPLGEQSFSTMVPLTSVLALSLLISGAWYVRSNARLYFIDKSGSLVRSDLPSITGLSVRGPWIPDFEELVRFSDREIPPGDGILTIPGEDPFFYATGRHPLFPVLTFDNTVNPYSPEEILNLSREKQIRWLIVKRDLQLKSGPVQQQKNQLAELLGQDLRKVASLGDYDVYKR